jgi:methyl-accepting chemotaxis protein
MASSKDDRKDEAKAKTEQPSLSSQEQRQEELREAIVEAFDEAKDKTQRIVKESKKEIPHFTSAINNYQEQTLQAVREIAENYIDTQKEIINSFQQSTWISQLGDTYRTFWLNWMLPKNITETYANIISNSIDNTFAATRVTNNMISATMGTFNVSAQQTKDNLKELSKAAVSNAKILQQTAGEYLKSLNELGARGSTQTEVQKR